MTEDRWLTVTEVAERLRCHRATVHKMIKAGKLRYMVIGAGKRPFYRVPESELAGLEVGKPGRPPKERE